MDNSLPQKRKSLTLEKKLQVYEFEVDENEPKIKHKKKRGPKPGAKNKLKWGSTKKTMPKSPVKNQEVKKPPSKRMQSVPSVKNDTKNIILSTKNSSSPLFENKQRPLEEGSNIGKRILQEQKNNLTHHNLNVSSSKKESPRRIISAKNKIHLENKGKTNISILSQKENLSLNAFDVHVEKQVFKKEALSATKPSLDHKRKNSNHNEEKGRSHPTFDVPVLFHNHQDATPGIQKKSLRNEKPGYTAMSDDENVNKSYEGNCSLDHFFSSNSKKSENNDMSSRTPCNDSSCGYINASTPVKYNYNDTCSSSSVLNCFGFEELELFEEPLVSPIKISEASGSSYSELKQNTPSNLKTKKINFENKEEIPVTQVIKMLKYGTDEVENLETRSKSSSNSTSPIFNDVPSDEEKLTKPEKIVKAIPRRSYERPSYLRHKNKSFQEEISDEDTEEKSAKPLLPKKRQGQSKKEQDEMQKWIKAFNSQCQEIEKFDLLVE